MKKLLFISIIFNCIPCFSSLESTEENETISKQIEAYRSLKTIFESWACQKGIAKIPSEEVKKF